MGILDFRQVPDQGLPPRLSDTSLNATIGTVSVPRWAASTAYSTGDKVISPNGDVVSAITSFTSGGSFNAANWDLSANVAGKLDKTEAATTYQPKARTFPRSALWVYGHSYTTYPGQFCTAGQEWMAKVVSKLGLSGYTTYGVGNSRMLDTYGDIANQATTLPVTGSTWVNTRKGLVVIQSEFNDCVNAGASSELTTLTDAQALGYERTLAAALAIINASERIEQSAGTVSGTWNAAATGNPYSGGSLRSSNAQNAYTEWTNVTIPQSGAFSLLTWDVSAESTNTARGEITITVDGVSKLVEPAATAPWASIRTKRGTLTQFTVGPRAYRITGITPGTHTIRVTKTDAGTGNIFIDALLPEAYEPNPVVVLKDPPPATSGSNVTTQSANRAIMLANRTKLSPRIDAAIAPYRNVALANLAGFDLTTDLASDGAHPGDQGMITEADRIIEAARKLIANYDVDALYA